jgi:uncharacterized protein YjbI with pentapeptide repeats
MIEIRHRHSGRVLASVDAEGLAAANLAGAYLIHADLREADLSGAVLVYADLSGADLTGANLTGAKLRGSSLIEAVLVCADLRDADLAHATVSGTAFHDCRNLHAASGLDRLHHRGPSSVDERTLRASAARLPYSFLRGVGFTRADIERLRERYGDGGDGT